MAYAPANLHLNPVAPGSSVYRYNTSTDSMFTVSAAGYFTSGGGTGPTGTGPKLTVGDLIYAVCTDGAMWLKVSAVSATTGAATTQFGGGNLPIGTLGTGSAAEFGSMSVPGYYELATTSCSATRYVLPPPYPGAEIRVMRKGSGTGLVDFDAGGSAGTHWAAASGTTIIYSSDNDRRFETRMEGDWFHVVGSTTQRWRVYGMNFQSSGSDDLGGGGSAFITGT